MEKNYQNLSELLSKELVTKEDHKTEAIINSVCHAKERGFLSKEEFLRICLWKSPRPQKWYESNDEDKIIRITKQALEIVNEEDKVEHLTLLKGVSVPVASALLTLIDPVNYGVIDIRVWQILYLYGEVSNNPEGKYFKTRDWSNYLSILRKYAKEFKVKTRDVEKTLFIHHAKIQEGNLYD